jgi:hypothetical protein
MSILRWILGAGVVGGLIYKTSKKAKDIAEEENRRKNTLCFFDDGISEYEFEILVKCAGKGIKRLKSITVVAPSYMVLLEHKAVYRSGILILTLITMVILPEHIGFRVKTMILTFQSI